MKNNTLACRTMLRLALCLSFAFLVSFQPLHAQGGGLGRGKGKGFEHAKKDRERIKRNKIMKEDQVDDHGNKKSSKSYDENGNKTKEITYHPDGSVERTVDYSYNTDEDLDEAVVYDSTDTEVSRNKFQYDNGKRLGRSITKSHDGVINLITDFSYDSSDNMTDVHGMDSTGRTIRRGHHSFDASGKIKETRVYGMDDSLETTVTYATDDSGNITEQITRDATGKKLQRSTFEYDDQGNITRIRTYDENDSLSSETVNEYDSKGRLVKTHGNMPALDMEDLIQTDYDDGDDPVEQRTYNKNGDLVDTKDYKYEKRP